jgi:hypothetical protein
MVNLTCKLNCVSKMNRPHKCIRKLEKVNAGGIYLAVAFKRALGSIGVGVGGGGAGKGVTR